VRRLPQYRNISYNDVIEAVKSGAEHGLIPGIRSLRGGVKVVGLRPVELSPDQADVVNLAASNGRVTVEEVMMQMKWSEDHARQVLMSLVESGMAVADIRFSTGGRYYFLVSNRVTMRGCDLGQNVDSDSHRSLLLINPIGLFPTYEDCKHYV